MDKKNKLFKVTTEFVESLSRKFQRPQYLQFIIDTVQDFTNCYAVGIRVLNDDGCMPYEIYTGFSDEFWKSENLLNLNYDQCVCTRLVNRQIEKQDLPGITEGGSFNNLSSFFEGLSVAEGCRFRGECVDYGYKSLAVIPIIYEQQPIGVLHLADERSNLITDEMIELLETLTPLIGEAMRRYCLEDELRRYYDNRMLVNALLNDANFRAYVSDLESYKLLYATKELLIEHCGKEIAGGKCYQKLYGLSEPCSYCRINELKNTPTRSFRWEVDNSGGESFIVIDKLIPWSNGRDAHFQALIDITEKKLYEKRLEYLNFHDPVTGLYNRTYFNLRMTAFELNKTSCLGLILLDIDGLRLLNEAKGQDEGDSLLKRFAGMLEECFDSNCVVARIDGDEFGVLIPGAASGSLEGLCKRIKLATAGILHESVALSVSAGYALREGVDQSIDDLFKEAERNMKREKIHHAQSARSDIIKVLTEALKARDHITEEHANRLQYVVSRMAKALGLNTSQIADLRLFAEFHDLGKVGIPDRILYKAGPLTDDEWSMMKEHPSIGFRIAHCAPDLAPISKWILHHHENWNGFGYPFGLKGNDIPLECRILSIADAYDAMTNDRPYRKGMTNDEAIAELRRCSGTQFDPSLVELFISEIQE